MPADDRARGPLDGRIAADGQRARRAGLIACERPSLLSKETSWRPARGKRIPLARPKRQAARENGQEGGLKDSEQEQGRPFGKFGRKVVG